MPIKIPNNLPGRPILESEGVMIIREADAIRQDIRPINIGLLNLMPNKIKTETQFARLLGSTPLQIDLTLVRMTNHVARNTSQEHLSAFYQPWEEVKTQKFDGFIITGAPVEKLPFEEVGYWQEMCDVLDWTQTHVHRTMTICWAAQAAAYHFYKMPKYARDTKATGVYRQRTLVPASPYLRGFSDDFCLPVSRWTETRKADIPAESNLAVLAEDDETGMCLLDDPDHRSLHMFNHIEYDTTSLADEFERDSQVSETPIRPQNYFPGDDATLDPVNRWRAHAHLLFGNWINEMYQTTPFDLEKIGE
ncbi:homoserine O-succinyltransferase [Labrenzia sp. PHM005]|uniref:homoserine O-succinyltransferase n=1 Tax=Labrenzia sp. PHM005 TaxID=2590016 RepID=UPI00113FD71B|nr:homoserine O-succinyltransferase [Labrenzia sp. PHM005]QDG78001.1 homoserine O-succinyltransferase [Labrenzia sp. PHM005]